MVYVAPEPVVQPEPEPEPVVYVAPEPVVQPEPEPEPVVYAEPEPVAQPEPEPEPEPVAYSAPEPVEDIDAERAVIDLIEGHGSPPPPPTREAGEAPAAWFEDPDVAPIPPEQVAPSSSIFEEPSSPPVEKDAYLDRLMDGAETPPVEPVRVPRTPEREAGPPQKVDRAAVVRELASLFNDEEGSSPGSSASADPQGSQRRLEDDDELDKGLIHRLIDGVKGL